MTTYLAEPTTTPDIAAGTWQLDLSRSSVEFHVRSFYGLITVKGSFHQYAGTLDLGREPAVEPVDHQEHGAVLERMGAAQRLRETRADARAALAP